MSDKKEVKKPEEAPKKVAKKVAKKSSLDVYKITKTNGSVIARENLSDALIKGYEDKGWKVEKD